MVSEELLMSTSEVTEPAIEESPLKATFTGVFGHCVLASKSFFLKKN